MRAFTRHSGIVAPLDRANVDTDAIIPKQYLKSIKRSGFGAVLFDSWRYLEPGEPDQDHSQRQVNPDFMLNQPPYDKATILLSRENFGCGSSREHAVWALNDFGFRAVIAPSFADIFFSNSIKNGLLPIVIKGEIAQRLFSNVAEKNSYQLDIDLQEQVVSGEHIELFSFDIDTFYKHCLLKGLDEIDLTLANAQAIRAYETQRQQQAPWLFPDCID